MFIGFLPRESGSHRFPVMVERGPAPEGIYPFKGSVSTVTIASGYVKDTINNYIVDMSLEFV